MQRVQTFVPRWLVYEKITYPAAKTSRELRLFKGDVLQDSNKVSETKTTSFFQVSVSLLELLPAREPTYPFPPILLKMFSSSKGGMCDHSREGTFFIVGSTKIPETCNSGTFYFHTTPTPFPWESLEVWVCCMGSLPDPTLIG